MITNEQHHLCFARFARLAAEFSDDPTKKCNLLFCARTHERHAGFDPWEIEEQWKDERIDRRYEDWSYMDYYNMQCAFDSLAAVIAGIPRDCGTRDDLVHALYVIGNEISYGEETYMEVA